MIPSATRRVRPCPWVAGAGLRVAGWVRRVGQAGVLAGAMAASVAAPVQASGVTVVDDLGRSVRVPAGVQRVVSLSPSLTESVCALDACARLVGVDRYSNWPATVQRLPRVGGGLDPSVEAIVALRPDLVLLASSTRLADRLAALGVTVLAFEPKTHEQVRHTLERLGLALGSDRAGAVWQRIETELRELGPAPAHSSGPSGARARVYVEVDLGPYAAGEASFIGQTLARLGARNVVPAALGPFPRLNPEFVVQADPDLILIGTQGAAELAQRPGWGGLTALRRQRVCVLAPDQLDLLVRAGPRLAEAARLMAQCLRRWGPG